MGIIKVKEPGESIEYFPKDLRLNQDAKMKEDIALEENACLSSDIFLPRQAGRYFP